MKFYIYVKKLPWKFDEKCKYNNKLYNLRLQTSAHLLFLEGDADFRWMFLFQTGLIFYRVVSYPCRV